jgi:hypothetical protein
MSKAFAEEVETFVAGLRQQSDLAVAQKELALVSTSRKAMLDSIDVSAEARLTEDAKILSAACFEYLDAAGALKVLRSELSLLTDEATSDGSLPPEIHAALVLARNSGASRLHAELRSLLNRSVLRRARTSKNGRFTFTRLLPGRYVIVAEYKTATSPSQAWILPVFLLLSEQQDLSNFNMQSGMVVEALARGAVK